MTLALACASAAFLTLAVCAVVFAHTARTDAQDARADCARDNARHAATIDMLCQRIQSPETAVAQHVADHGGGMPQPPPLDDDKAYWDAVRENSGETD